MNKFINAKLSQTPPMLKAWFKDDKLRELTAESLADDIERLISDQLAKLFHQHANVQGVSTFEAYKTRLLELPELGEAICGIRFRGMDITRPFVNVAVHTQPLTASGMVKSVAVLAKQFAEFQPKHLRFYVPSHINVALSAIEALGMVAQWDRAVVANCFGELNTQKHHLAEKGFTLEIAETTDFYADYVRVYEELFEQQPQLVEYTRCETQQDMQSLIDEGGVHAVLRQSGEFAGLVSLARDPWGLWVIEKVLASQWHNQGIGQAFEAWTIQTLLVQNLVRQDEVLFGEIDNDNKASLQCALNNGRKILGRYLWVAIE